VDHEFKIHKLILATSSNFFAKAFNGDWKVSQPCPISPASDATNLENKESEDGVVDLSDNDPAAIEAMLEFMYTYDYEQPIDNTRPAVFHARMYKLADRYDVPELRKLARKKFKQSLRALCRDKKDEDYTSFLLAVAEVYENAPPNDKCLRKIVGKIASQHTETLMDDDKFQELMDSVPGFSADIARSLICKHEKILKRDYILDPRMRLFQCSVCDRTFEKSLVCRDKKYSCPECSGRYTFDEMLGIEI
jgi:speckle-type POZ protein